jgi:alpha-L-fucosidase
MKNLILILCIVIGLQSCNSPCNNTEQSQTEIEKYIPTWTSLQKHETPQWLKDAKFGIYTHVTLQTIANIGGNENKFKHELIEDFKLEKFNAAEWAELFKRTGAKFAGPVAWHGSGMLHWDSDITKFNTVDMGPGIDLIGELKKEIYARDMKLITSFHTGYWYAAGIDQTNPGRKNPAFEDLYGPAHDLTTEGLIPWKNHIENQDRFSIKHMESWLAKMDEAVNKYQPDISWVDVSFGGTVRAYNKGRFKKGKLISEDDIYFNGVSEIYQRKYISNFFNKALEQNKEVEFVYKEYDVPPGIGMRNIENGLLDELTYDTWMTDIDMCQPVSWFYKEGMGIKDANLIIDILCDVTAKNGILLLNVPPKPDGSFADFIVEELHEIGDWLQLNGEAIYGTMPWSVYGEGPSNLPITYHYSEGKPNASYSEKDFRFTQKDNILYCICMGVPKGEIKIKSLGSRGRLFQNEIKSIELLGSDASIVFKQNINDLTLSMPASFKGKHACVFKIERVD